MGENLIRNSQKINDPMKKWANELNRAFSKEEIQMAKTHEEILSICSHKGNANQSHIKIQPYCLYSSMLMIE
jgi:hypothetical protein